MLLDQKVWYYIAIWFHSCPPNCSTRGEVRRSRPVSQQASFSENRECLFKKSWSLTQHFLIHFSMDQNGTLTDHPTGRTIIQPTSRTHCHSQIHAASKPKTGQHTVKGLYAWSKGFDNFHISARQMLANQAWVLQLKDGLCNHLTALAILFK